MFGRTWHAVTEETAVYEQDDTSQWTDYVQPLPLSFIGPYRDLKKVTLIGLQVMILEWSYLLLILSYGPKTHLLPSASNSRQTVDDTLHDVRLYLRIPILTHAMLRCSTPYVIKPIAPWFELLATPVLYLGAAWLALMYLFSKVETVVSFPWFVLLTISLSLSTFRIGFWTTYTMKITKVGELEAFLVESIREICLSVMIYCVYCLYTSLRQWGVQSIHIAQQVHARKNT